MQPGEDPHKQAHLEGLRGVAALVVVAHHYLCTFFPAAIFGGGARYQFENWLYNTPLQVLVAGNFAVCVFFALSGYVLSYRFIATKDVAFLRSGAIKRYFRLAPPIFAAVMLSYGLYRLGGIHNAAAAKITGSDWLSVMWPHAAGSLPEALWQGTVGQLLGKANPDIFDKPLWTMNVEFFGSLAVFAFLAAFGMAKKRWMLYIVAAGFCWNSYYLAFIFGMALCDALAIWPKQRFHPITLGLAGAAGLLLGSTGMTGPVWDFYSQLRMPFAPNADVFALPHTLGAGLVLAVVLYSGVLKRLLATRPMVYLGKISFSLYLVHMVIIGSVGCGVFVWLSSRVSYGWAAVGAAGAVVLVLGMVVPVFARAVDQPAVRLANRIARHWRPPNSAT